MEGAVVEPEAKCPLESGNYEWICRRLHRKIHGACGKLLRWIGSGWEDPCKAAASLFLQQSGGKVFSACPATRCAYCETCEMGAVWEDVLGPEAKRRWRLSTVSLDSMATPEGDSLELPDRSQALLVDQVACRLHWAGGLPEKLAGAIRELTAREQNILRLHYFEGLTDREIACRMGIEKTNTVCQIRKRTEHNIKRMCACAIGCTPRWLKGIVALEPMDAKVWESVRAYLPPRAPLEKHTACYRFVERLDAVQLQRLCNRNALAYDEFTADQQDLLKHFMDVAGILSRLRVGKAGALNLSSLRIVAMHAASAWLAYPEIPGCESSLAVAFDYTRRGPYTTGMFYPQDELAKLVPRSVTKPTAARVPRTGVEAQNRIPWVVARFPALSRQITLAANRSVTAGRIAEVISQQTSVNTIVDARLAATPLIFTAETITAQDVLWLLSRCLHAELRVVGDVVFLGMRAHTLGLEGISGDALRDSCEAARTAAYQQLSLQPLAEDVPFREEQFRARSVLALDNLTPIQIACLREAQLMPSSLDVLPAVPVPTQCGLPRQVPLADALWIVIKTDGQRFQWNDYP